jgi:branched-subunit amino acid aminotransferase/4-amino-4-deoxychorismate lyase
MTLYKPEILDTFLFKNKEIVLKTFHAERTYETYHFLNLNVDYSEIENLYSSLELKLKSDLVENSLVRLLLSPAAVKVVQIELKDLAPIALPVRLQPVFTNDSISVISRFKFNDRRRWTDLLKSTAKESDDIILINNNSQVVETSRYSFFYYDQLKDLVYTPDLNSGCLSGVFRKSLIADKKIKLPDGTIKNILEKNFTLEEVAQSPVWVGNSVRGLLPAIILT